MRSARPGLRAALAGFSLIELVIVVVIVGIIGAIAAPRLSRGAGGASESAAIHNEHALQSAIERYAAEHEGAAPDEEMIAAQLTGYTDLAGTVSATKGSPYIYGPYLRNIPAQPYGGRSGASGIAAADADNVGWIYEQSSGLVRGNLGP